MNRRNKPLLTRIAIWWLREYDECLHFWIRFNWLLAITIFIIGALESIDLGTIGMIILGTALILNIGLVLVICTLRQHLLTLKKDAPGREEVHDLLIHVIHKRILDRYSDQ